MKVLALNPPFHNKFSREMRSPAVTKSGTLYYPMWLCYAAGLLEENGFNVSLIDAPAECISTEDIIEREKDNPPELIIINTSTPSIYNDVQVAVELKKELGNPIIALLGTHVSALPEETLKLSGDIDIVVVGEFEFTVLEIAKEIRDKKDYSNLKGIAWQNEGIIKINEKRDLVDDLDSFPIVSKMYKKHLNISDYFYGHSLHPIVVFVTGRGCPFHCTYCVYPQTLHGHKYRMRSIDNIIEEFRYVHENIPECKEIMIEDDTLTVNKKRCKELSERLISEKLTSIPWSANSRADVDLETMKIMNKAGCRLFCVGFESGDQTILDNIKKGTNLKRINEFAKDMKKSGILIHGCFMVGNQGETKETLQKTLDLALHVSPDTAQFFPIMVYPGTEAYDWNKQKGYLISEDYSKWVTDTGLHNSVVSNPELSFKELVNFCDHARRKFYLRPSYIVKKVFQGLINFAEFKRNFKGFTKLIKHLVRGNVYKEE